MNPQEPVSNVVGIDPQDPIDLERICRLVLSGDYAHEFDFLKRRFGLDDLAIINQALQYSFGLADFTNNDYNSYSMRTVLHLHQRVPISYHSVRQQSIGQYLDLFPFRSAIDIGFGVPAPYLLQRIPSTKARFTLADKDEQAQDFASALLEYLHQSPIGEISFQRHDMDFQGYVGDFDVYLLLDSIEHTKDPMAYLRQLVSKSPDHARFIISLPICTKDSLGIHHIEWRTESDALDWLQTAGLRMRHQRSIHPLEEVDLFAKYIVGGFHNLVVECIKS